MESSQSCLEHPVPLLDLARENGPLLDECIQRIKAVMESGRFVLGPQVKELESEIARLSNTTHAVGCASGSDALLLCLMALNIKPGDEVIVPSFTFFATASAVWRLGATPVFVDILPDTFNMDVEHFKQLITPKTQAVIPVHMFGRCADMTPILEIAKEHDIVVVEDCAQSIGATYQSRSAGSMGLAGCYSFYPTKNLGAMGDAGIITTNDSDFAEQLELYRSHGMKPRYEHHVVGVNSRLDSLQAAILLAKIPYLKQWSEMRRQNALRYRELFKEAGIDASLLIPPQDDVGAVWNQFTIRVSGGQRNSLRKFLADNQIGSEIYYPLPLHRQPCFASLGYEEGDLPVTDMLADEVLSLPIFPHLTEGEQRRVVACIAQYLEQATVSNQAA